MQGPAAMEKNREKNKNLRKRGYPIDGTEKCWPGISGAYARRQNQRELRKSVSELDKDARTRKDIIGKEGVPSPLKGEERNLSGRRIQRQKGKIQ